MRRYLLTIYYYLSIKTNDNTSFNKFLYSPFEQELLILSK